jgi:hypothetical protein
MVETVFSWSSACISVAPPFWPPTRSSRFYTKRIWKKSRNSRINALIDRNVGVGALEAEDDAAVDIAVALPNGDTLTLTVEVSRLLFEFDRDAYVVALIASREAESTGNGDIETAKISG